MVWYTRTDPNAPAKIAVEESDFDVETDNENDIQECNYSSEEEGETDED